MNIPVTPPKSLEERMAAIVGKYVTLRFERGIVMGLLSKDKDGSGCFSVNINPGYWVKFKGYEVQSLEENNHNLIFLKEILF